MSNKHEIATNLLQRPPPLDYKLVNLSSKYTGVSWDLQSKKWKATIYANGKQKFLGYFAVETEAASKYDEAAKSLDRPLNFPKADQPETTKKIRRGSSRYTGVHWDSTRKKWKAQIKIDGKEIYLGYFNAKQQAARNYDQFAASLRRPLNIRNEITDERGLLPDTSIDKKIQCRIVQKKERARSKVFRLMRQQIVCRDYLPSRAHIDTHRSKLELSTEKMDSSDQDQRQKYLSWQLCK